MSANSDNEMMEISLRVSAKLSEYSTNISLNEGLWQKVKEVYENKDMFKLDAEDKMLLQRTYDSFARSGANLQGADRDVYRKLSAELSELTTKFGQNVLKELNTYEIWLTKDDLAGLPESSIEAAALAAKEKNREGEYLFTLAQPTYTAFMKYSSRQDLREKMYRLYNGRNQKGEFSNVEVMKRIVEVRREIANLLGYKTYAQYSLERTMAQTPENVYNLLDQLRDAYRPAQENEFKADTISEAEKKISKWYEEERTPFVKVYLPVYEFYQRKEEYYRELERSGCLGGAEWYVEATEHYSDWFASNYPNSGYVMDFEDFIVSYNILPLGSLLMVLFCNRANGWGFHNFVKEADTGIGIRFPRIIHFYCEYILPVIILVIYFKGYYDTFSGRGLPHLITWMTIAVLFVLFILYCASGKKIEQE